MKTKKDKIVHGFKLYSFVMQEIWKLLSILLIGTFFGYILSLKGPEGNHFIVYALIISIFVGLLVLFMGLMNIIKREEKAKAKEASIEEDNSEESIQKIDE